MKKVLPLLLSIIFLFGLAACSSTAIETVPSEEAAGKTASAPLSTPTIAPTPTPEPTPEPLTEGQQWYFDCIEYKENGKEDIYAICQAMLAYKNGELYPLIDNGKIKSSDIAWLEKRYQYYSETYDTFADDFVSGTYGDRELNITETLLAILRGDNLDNIEVYYDFKGYNEYILYYIKMNISIISVFPKESREKISKIINVFDNINGKDVSELEQLLNVDDLSWTEWWYVIHYIMPENAYEIQVLQNGESVSYLDYMCSPDFLEHTLKIFVKIEENFNKISAQPSNEFAEWADEFYNNK